MHIICFDPGSVRVGISEVKVDMENKRIRVWQFSICATTAFLGNYLDILSSKSTLPDIVLIEDYIMYSNIESPKTQRVIGAIQFAYRKSKNHLQLASQRELGRKVFRFKKPSHDPDHLSAFLHILSWGLQNKAISPDFKIITESNTHELHNFRLPEAKS